MIPIELTINGKAESVLLRELQWDHLGKVMIHADFARIDRDGKVRFLHRGYRTGTETEYDQQIRALLKE